MKEGVVFDSLILNLAMGQVVLPLNSSRTRILIISTRKVLQIYRLISRKNYEKLEARIL